MMSPHEIESLADAIVERLSSRLPDEGWIDIHGAAQVLGCSVPTVERLVRDGKIPSSKFGRLRRFRRTDLMAMNQKGGCDE
jgi:excisionase family DNA binding protein